MTGPRQEQNPRSGERTNGLTTTNLHCRSEQAERSRVSPLSGRTVEAVIRPHRLGYEIIVLRLLARRPDGIFCRAIRKARSVPICFGRRATDRGAGGVCVRRHREGY
jgi:hypothetical protein